MSIFKKQPVKKKQEDTQEQKPLATGEVKYPRPKILAIDLAKADTKLLTSAGFNVVRGSFGTPYRVPKGSGYHPVLIDASLPNYTEQEIIIADLAAPKEAESAKGEKAKPDAELHWWAKSSTGLIDPRPRVMAMVDDVFARILSTGGAFILFADSRKKQKLVFGAVYNQYQGITIDHELNYDNWSLLPLLSELMVESDHGFEITPTHKDSPVGRLLADHLEGASFNCTLSPAWRFEDRWLDLAKNKYGETVAGVISPPDKSKAGWIFIFPRLQKKAGFLAAFIKNVLPDICPTLFPHAEGQRWVHRPEYELQSVVQKAAEISRLQDETAAQVKEFEKAIEADREKSHYLYDLLRETGRPLVEAVKTALSVLGFTSIVDVDEEMKIAGNDTSLREDLRIHDTSPVLITDVKGVAGHPADAEALQAQKHAFIYIQEQGRADVRGLTIINHQRLLPPLDRDNAMPFRQEILDNATQVSLGLITTWDLFRLLRGFTTHGWRPEHIKPLLYRVGRILPIPLHYEYVGKVNHVWKNAFSVVIEAGELRVGDRISIEFPVDFDEQTVTSLRLNDEAVEHAQAGVEVGIGRPENLPEIKIGFHVYRISAATGSVSA